MFTFRIFGVKVLNFLFSGQSSNNHIKSLKWTDWPYFYIPFCLNSFSNYRSVQNHTRVRVKISIPISIHLPPETVCTKHPKRYANCFSYLFKLTKYWFVHTWIHLTKIESKCTNGTYMLIWNASSIRQQQERQASMCITLTEKQSFTMFISHDIIWRVAMLLSFPFCLVLILLLMLAVAILYTVPFHAIPFRSFGTTLWIRIFSSNSWMCVYIDEFVLYFTLR